MPRLTHTLGLIALFPLLSGCVAAAVGAAGVTAVTASQERTIGEAVDDTSLSSSIKAKLLAEGGMLGVSVDTNGGLVLLTGRVDTPEKKLRAESISWANRLTRDVANNIVIGESAGFFANASDSVISGRVRARLVGSSSVKARNINVETYGGVVYLMGVARNAEELEAAAYEASLAQGVVQVVSYVRLRDDRGEIVPYQPSAPSGYDSNELLGGPAG